MKKIAVAVYKPLESMEDERLTIGKEYEAFSNGEICFITDNMGKLHGMTFGFFKAHFVRLI